MRDFLWKGQAAKKGGYKVAWRKITCPLSEGGLGIKSIGDWNSAALAKHLWRIIQPDSNSLWVNWMKENVLKDKPFWAIFAPQDSSWTWHKILSLRDKFKNCIKYLIGNGQLVFLWYDFWLPCGPLVNLGELIQPVFDAHRSAKVAAIIRHGRWRWPWSSVGYLRAIKHLILDLPPPNYTEQDKVLWSLSSSGTFTIRSAWEHIRHRGEQVNWKELVWFQNKIPKHAFFLWLAFQGKLGTKDRGFNTSLNTNCLLCDSHIESHDHLFFKCIVCTQIWNFIQQKCGLQSPRLDWIGMIEWLAQHWKGRSLEMDIRKLYLAATIYIIWQERNSRLHNNRANSSDFLCDKVLRIIRLKLSTFHRIPSTGENRQIQMCWNLPSTIFE